MITEQQLTAGLAGLRTTAPESVGFGALVQAGLADQYALADSPLGPAFVAWNGRGVSWVGAAGDPADFEDRFRARSGRPIARADALPAKLRVAIERRLAGDRRARIELDLRGATFVSGGEPPTAAEIGRPKAVRAVGTALAHNPIPLVVPCHRVVRSDGTIGRYSLGGPENKRRILAAEGLDPDAMEAEAGAGIRFLGSDTTHIVCLPTCQHARRITARHRVPFGSLRAARAAGYRPCRRCRPVSLAA